MQTIIENGKVNRNLAQFKHILHNTLLVDFCRHCTEGGSECNRDDVKWQIKNMQDINDKVIATNYLQSEHSGWIGYTALHFAVFKVDEKTFEILLNKGADFTVKNNQNSTSLHQIVENRMTDILKKYELHVPFVDMVLSAHLENSNFHNPMNNTGLSHFHIACAANNIEVVKGFINSGISVHHTVDTNCTYFRGFSPLHFAAKFLAVEVVDVLLSHGANLQMKDARGLTPLHIALERKMEIVNDAVSCKTRNANEKIIVLLLNKNSNSDLMNIDDWGLTNLHVSCMLEDSKIAAQLLHKVTDINHTVSMDSPLWPGFTALHFAALCNIDNVKSLMKREADMNIKNAAGLTPLDMCVRRYKPQNFYGILSLNPVLKNITLSDGQTRLTELLFAMRDSKQFELFLKKLSKSNISINVSPLWPGCTLMHLAVMFAKTNRHREDYIKTNLQILEILCKQSPDMLLSQDFHGRTPVHLAIHSQNKEVLDLLSGALVDCSTQLLDCVDEEGLTFVHIASATNQTVLLEKLLAVQDHDYNVDAVYRGQGYFFPMLYPGSTALHFAATSGSAEAAQMLIARGANVYARNDNDMTPIHSLLFLDDYSQKSNLFRVLMPRANPRDCIADGVGLSHLHIATCLNNMDAVKKFLDGGSNIDSVVTYRRAANGESSKLDIFESFTGKSPLILAFDSRCLAMRNLLMKRGADCFIQISGGEPWLYSLIRAKDDRGWECFTKALNEREDVRARVRADSGMSALHVACLCRNNEDVQKLLAEGANVDERIRDDSPILQGYTALHILVLTWDVHSIEENEQLLKLLLQAGADVTLSSAAEKTAVHMAWEACEKHSRFISPNAELWFLRANKLLEAQRDFSVNPTSVDGTSHFHIACSACNVNVVENFLSHCDLDVNQQIDDFQKRRPGSTPLHMVAESRLEWCSLTKQLLTLDLLLKHGADVRVDDAWAKIPAHYCAERGYLDLLERLVRSGSDANARDVFGNTPLGNFSTSGKISIEGIRTLLRFGCIFNTFNEADGSGCVGQFANALTYAEMQNLLSIVMVNFSRGAEIDGAGRTIIQNLVSADSTKMLAFQYPELIEQISRLGYDVDDQDKSGTTALHMAVKFHNFPAVSGLLMAGADINIRDNDGNTAFACILDSCMECECQDANYEYNMKCKHHLTIDASTNYVNKLKIFELYVDKHNEDFALEASVRFESGSALNEAFFKELEVAKNTRIGSHALTLHDFLAENDAVADFPRMLIEKRQAVDKFFSPSEMPHCREKFPELAGILQLQYRKARARPQLVESAQNALAVCAGFRLPEICSDFILIFLKNSDLKNLITSTICNEDNQ